MAYEPNLPAGKAAAANSAPVTVASDVPVTTDLGSNDNRLNEIRQALMSLTAARGVLADLRVSVVNTAAVATHAVSQNGTWNVGTLSQVGTSNFNLNNAVPNWTNQTAVQSFTQNVTRP